MTRTTLDLDDDVLDAARELARARRQSIGVPGCRRWPGPGWRRERSTSSMACRPFEPTLLWESRVRHARARHWFADLGDDVVATCSVTQPGFVRVSSNPNVLTDAITVREATAILAALVDRPSHRFLPDDRGYIDNPLVPHDRLVGHR